MAATNLDQQFPKQPWLDIAKSDHFQQEKVDLKDIISLIDEYHLLKKTDKTKLQERINKLDKIFEQIKETLTGQNLGGSTRKNLEEFSIQCNGKRTYLRALINLEKTGPRQTLFGGVTEIPDLKGQKETYLLRTLRPLSMPGDVTAQSRDPLRRVPIKEFKKLRKQWDKELEIWLKHKRSKEKSSFTEPFPSFFMWLEDKDSLTQGLTTKPIFIRELMSVNKGILHPRKYRFSDKGLILDKNNKPLAATENTSNTTESPAKEYIEYIYTISPKGELYLKRYDSSKAFFHSDIINHHVPVICAGHIKIVNGKIIYIDNNSGHFQPTPFHMEQALRLLSAKNVFSPDAKVKVSYMTKEKHEESKEYNIKDFKPSDFHYTRQTRSVEEDEFKKLKESFPNEKHGGEKWWRLGKPMTTEEINKEWGDAYEKGLTIKYSKLWKKKVKNIPADKKKPKPKSDVPKV